MGFIFFVVGINFLCICYKAFVQVTCSLCHCYKYIYKKNYFLDNGIEKPKFLISDHFNAKQ